MNPKLLQVILRAQRHGWSIEYVSDEIVSLQKRFYRRNHRPQLMLVWHDGRIAKCRRYLGY